MSNQPKDKCSECGGAMEIGFLPEVAPGGSPFVPITGFTVWYGGAWEPQKFLGLKTGSAKIDWNHAEPITAYRCSQCGFVKLYASKPQPPEVREIELLGGLVKLSASRPQQPS